MGQRHEPADKEIGNKGRKHSFRGSGRKDGDEKDTMTDEDEKRVVHQSVAGTTERVQVGEAIQSTSAASRNMPCSQQENDDDAVNRDYLKEHFVYEVDMLMFSFSRLAELLKTRNEGKDLGSKNMMLEDFILHARNLRNFFYGPKKTEDAVAKHFVEDIIRWSRARRKERERPGIMEIYDRASKELAHLTYKRKCEVSEKKNWPCSTILREMLEVVDGFIDCVRKEYMSDELRSLKKRCLSVLGEEDKDGVTCTSTVSKYSVEL